jgi:hypothetical protein
MTCPDQQYDRLDSLGVRVSVINLGDAVRTAELLVEQQSLTFVCVTGAMMSHRGRTTASVMIGVGAPFDLLAGTEAPGARLGAAKRPGMGLSPVFRATPPVAPL